MVSIKEHIEEVRNGNISLKDFIPQILEKSERIQKKNFPFITINKELKEEDNKNPKGIIPFLPISIKDCICTKDLRTTGGSKILYDYVPPFDASCVTKVRENKGLIIGKTVMDEFGFGTFSTNTPFQPPRNPYDINRSCGGSSGGAGCLSAAADFPHLAIAESTGGSITAPAAFTGTVGITPTYGRVSRYGLIDYSNSMDKIGTMGKDVYGASLLLSVISGYDILDSTSANLEGEDFTKYINKDIKGMKIGLPREYFAESIDENIRKKVMAKVDKLEEFGISVEEFDIPIVKYSVPVYYIIALSEASSNLAKYCGLRYGMQSALDKNFDNYFSEIRSQGFGDEAKKRIILGTYARSAGFRNAYYIKALKIRNMIIKEFKKVFMKYDAIIAPSMPVLAPKFEDISKFEPIENYNMDILTTAPNMAGIPTISIPAGLVGGLPTGMQIIGDHFNEGKIISIAAHAEGV